MINIKTIALVFCLINIHSLVYADACNTSILPENLKNLIKDSEYDEAIKLARDEHNKNSKNKEFSLNLAKVYINATLVSGMNIDLSSLGFKDGESGKKKISMKQLKKSTSNRLSVNKKYFEETDEFIRKTVKKWPETKGLLYCLTKIHFYNRNHSRFIKLLSKTAEAHKNFEKEAVGFLANYGNIHIRNNRYEYATDVYETLLKTFPRAVPALSALGVAYIKRGYTKKSMGYFEKAHQIDPDDIIVIGNITEAAMLLTDFKKADKFLKLKIKHYPNKADTYFDLAINAMHKKPAKSLPHWKKYFEVNGKFPDSKTWSNNAKIIQNAVKEGKYNEYDWFAVGKQMISNHTPKYAVALMSYAYNKHPYDASISYGMAHAYDVGKHYDLEEKSLLETLKRMKNSKNKFKMNENEIYFNLSRCTFSLGREKDTLKYIKKINKNTKYAANADYMYGLVEEKRGNIKKAQTYFKSCVKKGKDSPYKNFCKNLILKSK